MNGTLALWYEEKVGPSPKKGAKSKAADQRPEVRLHVNLWRDLDQAFNFLDVGFLLRKVEGLGRLYLYVPAPIDPGSIFDLSNILKDADTLNAVFNEVAEIEREQDDYFITHSDGGKRRIIHRADPEQDIAVNFVNLPGRRRGTTIALNNALCDRISAAAGDEHYVRLRILLRDEARNLFTTDDAMAGVGLSLTHDVLETTEFRLNERRSYPPDILRRATPGQVNLRSVHYFLIRSKNHQLGSQHQNFRKVRYLEHDIWNGYIAVGRPADRRKRNQNRQAHGMIIYQWREIAIEEKPCLDDFIAYASFRTVRPRIMAYLVAILAIGGVGSAVLNVEISMLRHFFAWTGFPRPNDGPVNLYAGAILAVLAITPMAIFEIRRRWKR